METEILLIITIIAGTDLIPCQIIGPRVIMVMGQELATEQELITLTITKRELTIERELITLTITKRELTIERRLMILAVIITGLQLTIGHPHQTFHLHQDQVPRGRVVRWAAVTQGEEVARAAVAEVEDDN